MDRETSNVARPHEHYAAAEYYGLLQACRPVGKYACDQRFPLSGAVKEAGRGNARGKNRKTSIKTVTCACLLVDGLYSCVNKQTELQNKGQ